MHFGADMFIFLLSGGQGIPINFCLKVADLTHLFLSFNQFCFRNDKIVAKIANSAEVGNFLEINSERQSNSPSSEMMIKIYDKLIGKNFRYLRLVTSLQAHTASDC